MNWSPDEVIEKLQQEFEVTISRSTLLRYEKFGLIPEPERGGTGRQGRYTSYPEETVAEAYASWCLLHGNYGGKEEKELFGGKMPVLSPTFVNKLRKTANSQITFGALVGRKKRGEEIKAYYEPSEAVFSSVFAYYWRELKSVSIKVLSNERQV